MPTRRVLAVLAAVLAAACGPSKEHRLMDQRAAICNGLMAQQGVTLGDALNALPSDFTCGTPVAATAQPLANDSCGTGPIYRFLIGYVPNDLGLCKSGPYGLECGFFCELHATAADVTANAGGLSTPICAAQWFGPFCLVTSFCPYPTC